MSTAQADPFFRAHEGESPEDIDARWLREVYVADDSPQLTLKATLTGMVIGGILALSNLYVGLKTGWAFGISITACVLSYSIWRGLVGARLAKRPLGLLENNCMQSTASAAGYTIVSVMVTAVPAYLMITGVSIRSLWLVLWTFFLSALGCMLFVPFKRQLLNYEQLKFPSGIAAAQTLQGLHSRGGEAMEQARALFGGMGLGALGYWLSTNNTFRWWPLPRIPDSWFVPGSIAGTPLANYTLGLDFSGVSLAGGALIGLRMSCWMLTGSLLNYALLAPWLARAGFLSGEIHFGIIQNGYALWLGAAIMISASVGDLFFQRSLVARAFTGMGRLLKLGSRGESGRDALAGIEIPGAWGVGGGIFCTGGILIVGHLAFGIAWPLLLLAVLLSWLFVMVVCRAVGETDIAPVGQLGKIAQLSFGGLAPGRLSTNLMATSVTTTSAACASDLATNLKCGYLLGGNPRKQFVAQCLGIFVGAIIIVPAFYVLVPDASVLGTPRMAAPAAVAWRAIAELMSTGLSALGEPARWSLVVGSALGLALSVLSTKLLRFERWIPSAFGIGLGMVIPLSQSMAFVAGALLAHAAKRWHEQRAEKFTVAAASGVIAGESLLGVLFATLSVLGWMPLE